MPKPIQQFKAETYIKLVDDSARRSLQETNDCAVIAIAAACDVTYKQAWDAVAAKGRKSGKGAWMNQIIGAVESFGYKAVETNPFFFVSQYPSPHNKLKGITSHHPDRFKKVWKDGRTYMMVVSGGAHILTIKDGENMDWSRGRALRCTELFEIVKA